MEGSPNPPEHNSEAPDMAISATEIASVSENIQARNRIFWAGKTSMIKNRENGVKVPFFPLEQKSDIVKLPLEVYKQAVGKYDKALVGFVFGAKPFLGKIKGFVRSKWGDESVVKVQSMSPGIFMLMFASEEKKAEVLMGGPWSFDNRPLILQEWSEHNSYKCGSAASLPVWIRLPEIKAHLTDVTILGYLCSKLGKPICTDGVTAKGTSLNYARVCVEIYADMDYIDEIEYEDPYGNVYGQAVVYEWRPPKCTNCLNFGHLKDKCPEECLEDLIDVMKKHEEQAKREEINRLVANNINELHDDHLELEPGEIQEDTQVIDSAILTKVLVNSETTPEENIADTQDRIIVEEGDDDATMVSKQDVNLKDNTTMANLTIDSLSDAQLVNLTRVPETQCTEEINSDNQTLGDFTLTKSALKKARQREKIKLNTKMEANTERAYNGLTESVRNARNKKMEAGARKAKFLKH